MSERETLKKIIYILLVILVILFSIIFYYFVDIEPRKIQGVDNVRGKENPELFLKDISKSFK